MPRVDPPASMGINVTMRPPINKDTKIRPSNASISYRRYRYGGPIVDSMANAARINAGGSSVSGGAGPSRPDTSIPAEPVVPREADMAAAQVDRENSRKRGRQDPSAGPSAEDPTAASAPSGHSSRADGGFDSSQGPEHHIDRGGYKNGGGFMYFKKVHHLKSFAIPFLNIVESANKWVTTPLAEIPWDRMFFYMSRDEYKLIPHGSNVVSCKIEIQNLVSSTQFPTGATESTTATFNHPKIGILGFDLDKCSRGGQALKYNMSATKEMKVDSVSTINYDDFILKQYGTDQVSVGWNTSEVPGTCFPIPYNLYNYFTIYQPTFVTAAANGFTANNAPGYENFNSCLTQFNLNDSTWDTVFEREYKFTSAPIGPRFRALEISTSSVSSGVGNHVNTNLRRTITGLKPNEPVVITESIVPSNEDKVYLVNYQSTTIEQGANMSIGDAPHKPARQPTAYFGMKAIPKLSSLSNATRADEFVHAEVYFVVTASMTIATNSYPNRFVNPKSFNVSVENSVGGTGFRDSIANTNVTFGLNTDIPFV